MNDPILVTYASRTGSTAGVAEAIGQTLKEAGAQVVVLPIAQVAELAPYGAVVIGSAIQGAAWLPEAMQFVRAHQAELRNRPVALFTVCMTMAMKNAEKYRPGVAEWVEPVRALVRPVSEEIFAGALDIPSIPKVADRIKFRLSVLMGVWKQGDQRDWNAIRTWAAGLRPLLGN